MFGNYEISGGSSLKLLGMGLGVGVGQRSGFHWHSWKQGPLLRNTALRSPRVQYLYPLSMTIHHTSPSRSYKGELTDSALSSTKRMALDLAVYRHSLASC